MKSKDVLCEYRQIGVFVQSQLVLFEIPIISQQSKTRKNKKKKKKTKKKKKKTKLPRSCRTNWNPSFLFARQKRENGAPL